jgi:hydroxymethylpyrimidine/phosphomethylpyrimidine kinase
MSLSLPKPTVVALTLAGSDPSGGAGLQADLKTFHQHGVYGMSVVTLLTVQSTLGVTAVETVSPALVLAQLDSVIADIIPAAAKTGALGTADIVTAIAQRATRFSFPLVVDPVMVSKHGHRLLDAAAEAAIKHLLLPRATLITPNAPEASALTGLAIANIADAKRAAQALVALGAKAALVKGGHFGDAAVDVLFDGNDFHEFAAVRIDSNNTHGTGCTLSAAVTAHLACGRSLYQAIADAKHWISTAIATAPHLGHGKGPLNHFAKLR